VAGRVQGQRKMSRKREKSFLKKNLHVRLKKEKTRDTLGVTEQLREAIWKCAKESGGRQGRDGRGKEED